MFAAINFNTQYTEGYGFVCAILCCAILCCAIAARIARARSTAVRTVRAGVCQRCTSLRRSIGARVTLLRLLDRVTVTFSDMTTLEGERVSLDTLYICFSIQCCNSYDTTLDDMMLLCS